MISNQHHHSWPMLLATQASRPTTKRSPNQRERKREGGGGGRSWRVNKDRIDWGSIPCFGCMLPPSHKLVGPINYGSHQLWGGRYIHLKQGVFSRIDSIEMGKKIPRVFLKWHKYKGILGICLGRSRWDDQNLYLPHPRGWDKKISPPHPIIHLCQDKMRWVRVKLRSLIIIK